MASGLQQFLELLRQLSFYIVEFAWTDSLPDYPDYRSGVMHRVGQLCSFALTHPSVEGLKVEALGAGRIATTQELPYLTRQLRSQVIRLAARQPLRERLQRGASSPFRFRLRAQVASVLYLAQELVESHMPTPITEHRTKAQVCVWTGS